MRTMSVVNGTTAAPAPRHRGHAYVLAVTVLSGVGMLAAGTWALLEPRSFAEAVSFPYSEHFLHDAGAFEVGIGATLLLAVAWRDGLALALAGFFVANTLHAVNHAVDLDIGGTAAQLWTLVAWSVLLAVALVIRLRQLGYVVGEVTTAASPALEPFVRQKTVLLTSYRRDGTPVGTPLSVAVDGDHAYFRSYERAGKTRRLRNNPEIEIAPSTWRGRATGPALAAHARRLDGAEARRAACLLRHKHPFLHGIEVPFTHRAFRSKFGSTVHFELTVPEEARGRGVGSLSRRRAG
jgi:PPOX class probable F420-dependent enzyme